jgi:hypothetical protein
MKVKVAAGPTHQLSVRTVAAGPSGCPPITGRCVVAMEETKLLPLGNPGDLESAAGYKQGVLLRATPMFVRECTCLKRTTF